MIFSLLQFVAGLLELYYRIVAFGDLFRPLGPTAAQDAVIVRGKYDLRLINLAGKGVEINGEKIDARAVLNPGDIIEIGANRITVSIR